MFDADIDHEDSGLCWCGRDHSKMVESRMPAPDWAPNTSDDYNEDDADRDAIIR